MSDLSLSYQAAIQRLQEIIHLIESGSVDVDTLTTLIAEATTLVKYCSEKLTTIDGQVTKLLKQLNEETEPLLDGERSL